jgi:hypothetical protein
MSQLTVGNIAVSGIGTINEVRTAGIRNTAGTGSAYNPGSVVQFVDFRLPSTSDSYTVIAQDTAFQTPISVTITPRFANSKLVIHGEAQTRTIAGQGTTLAIRRDGTVINGSINFGSLNFFFKNDSANHHLQMAGNTSVIAGNTSATTFTVWIAPYGGSGEWNTGWGTNYIQVWEIAQ